MTKLQRDWPDGPWDHEPDEWREGDMIAHRQRHSGHWCGYVRIPDDHPAADPDVQENLEVHGGITWFGPLAGEEGTWIGFDCAHYMDIIPHDTFPREEEALVYWDLGMVKRECRKLREQIDQLTST